MWNKVFENLRRRMTFTYVLIFSVLILVVVAAAYLLIWYEILQHEKEELVAKIYHEGEEYIASGEAPVAESSMRNGSMFAYFVSTDGKTVILDQLSDYKGGEVIKKHDVDWPENDENAKMLRMHDAEGARLRYLAAVTPVKDGERIIGKLYMFKNMDFYYRAAYETLFLLLCVALVLVAAASLLGYWMAGKNIKPIYLMYEKQKQFTADASHEMRTPLTVLKLAIHGLEEDTDTQYSAFAKEAVEMLRDEVGRLSHLTETLMELARREASGIPLEKAVVNLADLCRKAVQKMEIIVCEKGGKIEAALPSEVKLKADGNAMKILLMILLDNAVKYSADNPYIKVSVTEKSDKVILAVADNGIGVSDDDKQKIFDRFYRVDKARVRSEGGLGLGLSLAQAIVKLHGGKIIVQDNVPRGTVMKVILPK